MIKHYVKTFSYIIIALFSLQAFAEDTISITVKTNEKTAAGIGYSVEGKDSGGAGKSYTGRGPKNMKYSFGYRRRGTNIPCGTLTLTKNSNVTLITKGNKCHSIKH